MDAVHKLKIHFRAPQTLDHRHTQIPISLRSRDIKVLDIFQAPEQYTVVIFLLLCHDIMDIVARMSKLFF